jgi:hypothetical protein
MRHWMFRPRAGTGGIFNSRESGAPPVALACNGEYPCYTLCPVLFGAISSAPEDGLAARRSRFSRAPEVGLSLSVVALVVFE